MVRRLAPWIPVIVLALGLFWASAQPGLRFAHDETEDFLVRKAGHMAVYAVGTVLVWQALVTTTRLQPAWAWAAGIAVAFAASDEFHQLFTRGREPTLRDVAIDALGVAAAVAIGLVVRQWRVAD